MLDGCSVPQVQSRTLQGLHSMEWNGELVCRKDWDGSHPQSGVSVF